VVYRAVQKSIDRTIAVKMIKPGVGRDPAEKNKFLTEALVTGRLDHPNIVPIHDLGTAPDGRPFYTMKMVRGTPWSEVLVKQSLEENLRILLDVCDAVSFAHSKGVIHRDLKPANVMLGEFGEVQLMDWGLGAVATECDGLTCIPADQAAGGTPSYMAPEMVTGEDGPVGTHSDIYLLGAILYEIVTGKPPHAGKRILECLENARRNVIEPSDRGGVLLEIALRAMRTDPRQRYATVKDFKQALLDYQQHAESIRLCQRSHEDLRRACRDRDYEAFAQALFGFRAALQRWEQNAEAQAGIVQTQLAYARCALDKGDLDLAASALDPDCPAHQSLRTEVQVAQRRRASAQRRLRFFRATVITLTATVIIVLTVGSVWIYRAKQQAVVAKEAAVAAQHAEAEQRQQAEAARQQAEAARAKAQQEEARALKALADLEKAYRDLVEAQEQERRAVARAEVSEQVATETRDELAKSGMLLDNSWWVFDAEVARQKQRAAAESLNMPVELSIALTNAPPLELVLIPAGEFVMGSPPKEDKRSADEHLHRVRITRPFYLGKYELTEAQWQAVSGAPPPSAVERAARPDLPATGVSYGQITREFLPALQAYAPAGYEFRLPTEAEWEYACRAGTPSAYHTGDDPAALEAAGWFLSNSNRQVQPVGRKVPNAFGLYDMHGNVGEICLDQHAVGFYLESPVDDPVCTGDNEQPVVRGGSVLNVAEHCRTAYRSYVYRKNRYEFLGLRVALAPPRSESSPTSAETTGP